MHESNHLPGYVPIDYLCTHCGGRLSAKHDLNVDMTIDGCYPLVFIHTKTLAAACPPETNNGRTLFSYRCHQ